jgi:hypothetical protein
LDNPVRVKVANGGIIAGTHCIPDCEWSCQGQFKTMIKVLPIHCYDMILGIEWLKSHGPMNIDWEAKWMEVTQPAGKHQLFGISADTSSCHSISPEQLQCLDESESLRFLVQLYVVEQETSLDVLPVPAAVNKILSEFASLFEEPKGLPPKCMCDHKIPLLPGSTPMKLRPYRYNPMQKNEIEKQVAELLKQGVLQYSSSPFASPALLVMKKDLTWRLCQDFRRLNAMIVKNKYPLPAIDELLDELAGSQWFTSLDMRAGYHQIRMDENDIPKTAFQTHHGHFEYKVMPYGLTGAPATFQGVMNEVLAPGLRKFVLVFIDNILIYSKTLEEHVEHVRQVFQMLQTNQLKVKKSKCAFARKELSYLGHVISGAGVSTDPHKIAPIVKWEAPVDAKQLRSFLGMAGYYRKFVRGYGIISKVLTELLRKGVQFVWTSEHEASFQALKVALTSTPVLALPDFSKKFIIETDACDRGIGDVLMQDGHPLAFLSKALGSEIESFVYL